MCGIMGLFSGNKQVDGALSNGIKALKHRGPDASRIWCSHDKRAGLAHARLSIIDLATGDQPISNETQRLHMVVNGEFYGYEKIRRELQRKGHQLRTQTDSEIALHLYEDHGIDCLKHLRGEFAFIIWDEEKEICFAARDRFGIKPLFFSVQNEALYLASEVKALFAAGVRAAWDEEAMAMFANSMLSLSDRHIFKNIYQIPPGHYLLARKGQIELMPYWDFDYPEMGSLPANLPEEEYVAQLRQAIEEAVRLRLRADVPVGCYLSGGLDSSAVLGLAAQHASAPIHAFTLSFEHEAYDEAKVAQEMAEHVGAFFHCLPIKQSDLADNFVEAVMHGEMFFINGHGIAKFLLSKEVRKTGHKVVLTGEGADEMFAGYPHFRVDQLLRGKNGLSHKLRQQCLHELQKTNAVSIGSLLPDQRNTSIDSITNRVGFTPAWLSVCLQFADKISGILADGFKYKTQALDGFAMGLSHLDIERQLKDRDPVNQSLYLWNKFKLPTYILTVLGDRMEMAHSVEGRVPFLDHHVAEFMRKVPVELKIRGMTEKYLLRKAAQPVLTKAVYERQKHPFLAPPAFSGAKTPFHDLLQASFRSKAMASVPFFDQQRLIALLDRLPHMEKKEALLWEPVLMVVLSACVIQEQFKLS